ncbi:MAG: hypothetical protein ACE5RI_05910 [Candidatus Nitrosomaritimum yanchengensis]
MFENILICSFAPENNKHVIDTSFEIAKKFNSKIIYLKCIHKELPTFLLFHTPAEKKKQEKLTKKMQETLDEARKEARNNNIAMTTESVFVESLAEYVTNYVNRKEIDLFIADSKPPGDITMHDHKDIVNHIYKNIDCPILTLK